MHLSKTSTFATHTHLQTTSSSVIRHKIKPRNAKYTNHNYVTIKSNLQPNKTQKNKAQRLDGLFHIQLQLLSFCHLLSYHNWWYRSIHLRFINFNFVPQYNYKHQCFETQGQTTQPRHIKKHRKRVWSFLHQTLDLISKLHT
jgi:hypothetical protein